jgi:hypothetical protein
MRLVAPGLRPARLVDAKPMDNGKHPRIETRTPFPIVEDLERSDTGSLNEVIGVFHRCTQTAGETPQPGKQGNEGGFYFLIANSQQTTPLPWVKRASIQSILTKYSAPSANRWRRRTLSNC